ncbi:sporulation protein YtxC [Alkalihalobacillus sp. AL-G]|uniref:sporulation protein YtxC n=1 Tax=Alkalihalobacillus sp. AL-G TaxID=2926399 RepID=UPI00272B5617|nr:sporulation protein YtxC [Alkalihalobacillus sp. AL-G]WLD95439.1 putative sporulation protein YtxC [Alkalihalobacillus sp. AL-G]
MYFYDEHEGLYLYMQLQNLLGNKGYSRTKQVNIQFSDANALVIDLKKDDPFSDMVKPSILRLIARHIIESNEDDWILCKLEQDFYYTDEDEQQQILTIVQSLLEGDDKDIPSVNDFPAREEVIIESLDDFFTNHMMFSYESFLQFRLKRYHELLSNYIECAIDEYKLEQEYQEFVHTLRQLIKERVSLFTTVHLVNEESSYKLLNEHFYELTPDDINHLISHHHSDPYPIASKLLKLLINLAPSKLFLYTDNEDASMNQTIFNVFQERVHILPRSKFDIQKRLCKNGHSIGLDFRR